MHLHVAQYPQSKPLSGFTLIELLVVISIIAVLAGMMMVAINLVRYQARESTCISQMRQWGLALSSYAHDFEGQFPSQQIPSGTGQNSSELFAGDYDALVNDYQLPLRMFFCPFTYATEAERQTGYTQMMVYYASRQFVDMRYAYWVKRSDATRDFPFPDIEACPAQVGAPNPGKVPLLSDYIGRAVGSSDPLYGGHKRGEVLHSSCQLFTDGHVELIVGTSKLSNRYDGNWENWH